VFVNKSNSIQVKILLSHYQGKAEEIGLLDTGATENFIDHTTVARLQLGTKKLPFKRAVYNVMELLTIMEPLTEHATSSLLEETRKQDKGSMLPT